MRTADLAIHGLVRYDPVLRLVRELPAGELLEVGSASSGVRGYGLGEPEWRVTVVDRSFDNYGQAAGDGPRGSRLVVGDARALPFEDSSFDVTLALDLMEHIAPSDRAAVLAELVRVTRVRAIVGCPTGAAALEVDRRLAERFESHRRPVPEWLSEHLANGLPEPAEIEDALRGSGTVRLIPNENVDAHERLMRVHFSLGALWPLKAAVAALRRGCASDARWAGWLLWLARGRDRSPAYRTIAVLDIGPA